MMTVTSVTCASQQRRALSAAISEVTAMFWGHQEGRELLLRASSLGRVAPVTWLITSALDSTTVYQSLKRRGLSR